MSKVIRQCVDGPSVFIGERQLDRELERRAHEQLAQLFPVVSVVTDPSGARLIPIGEVTKMESILNAELTKAREEGFVEGQQVGLKQGQKRAEEVLRQFEQAIRDTIAQREALFEEAREKILEMVIKVSEKITFGAFKADPELTLTLINGVIDTLIDRSHLKIRVNPDHLPVIEQNVDKFLRGSTAIKEIKIEPDSRVSYGGCFIETPGGDIDARLESQLEVLQDTLHAGEVEP